MGEKEPKFEKLIGHNEGQFQVPYLLFRQRFSARNIHQQNHLADLARPVPEEVPVSRPLAFFVAPAICAAWLMDENAVSRELAGAAVCVGIG